MGFKGVVDAEDVNVVANGSYISRFECQNWREVDFSFYEQD